MWGRGKIYKGEWVNNKMEGKGVMEWPDGRIYEGYFKDDMKEGPGKLIMPDGKVLKGLWNNDKLIHQYSAYQNSNIKNKE